jgi:Fe-S oxidoreductase
MCFKYCQSFPTLFEAVDERDGDVRQLPESVTRRVVDECFQCKLCYTQCPYTEAEGHEFELDFPRLMLRAKAIRRREEGVPLRERMLADPDRVGRLGTKTAALANWGNTFGPNRVLMEAVGGIHRHKQLPPFASQTFEAWFAKQTVGKQELEGEHPVVLFPTCYVNYNKPEVGKAAVRVLQHNDCRVACPAVECCGMPALDSGDIELAKKKARRNVEALAPWVDEGYRIAVINPTCSLMMRQEYGELLDDPSDRVLAEGAKRVAEATRDLGELLHQMRKEGQFREDFKSTPGTQVAYHAPCHLRMQNIGFRGRDLIKRIPGVKPKLVVECCGHDGTWAMKKEYFELAKKNGRKAFEGMQQVEADVWSTDCPLASLQFEQFCGKSPLHPVEVLDRAYREDGFPQRVETEEPE